MRVTPAIVTAQAESSADRLAIKTASKALTYAQLETRANQLAAHLRSLHVGPGVLVGIYLERSPQFVIAALAVMKCGAAYSPMDPQDPAERLRFMVKDADAEVVVTNETLSELFADLDVRVVALDAEQKLIERHPITPPKIDINPEELAYVIYTSGSTGQPKGVEIAHGNLSNLIAWHVRAFQVDSSTRATFQAGIGFDAAVWEIWPHLAAGAAIYIPDESTRMSPESLRDWLVANRITITFVSTAVAEQLLALSWPDNTGLRFLLTGGDVLHRFPPPGLPFALVNNYGPTECTVVATSGTIAPRANSDRLPSIGSPIDNVRIHIVDEQLHEVANGAIGEICIGGAAVGHGYRNRRELTAERFVVDHFSEQGGRLYRTGDIGRRLPNDEIAFLGRSDDQVKVRGHRIELGEISSVLNQQPSVQTSVVIAREDDPGEKRLLAYIVPAPGFEPDETALREAIRRRLPDYMAPSVFVWIRELPLTPNGKIDRAALPPPSVQAHSRDGEVVAPRNPIEEALAEIICDVLKLPRVSVHDDFFYLGAHSLLGAQIIAHVRSVLGAELKLLDVFDAPTVAQLSLRIEEALARKADAMNEAEIDAGMVTLNENANP